MSFIYHNDTNKTEKHGLVCESYATDENFEASSTITGYHRSLDKLIAYHTVCSTHDNKYQVYVIIGTDLQPVQKFVSLASLGTMATCRYKCEIHEVSLV